MESDDEMAAMMMEDSNDDEEFYGGGGGDGDDSSDHFMDQDSDDSDDLFSHHLHRSQNYTILNADDIRQCQEESMKKISTVLSISTDDAGILLCHYNWSVSKVIEEWFADEENVRRTVGLLVTHSRLSNPSEYGFRVTLQLICGKCFETCPRESMRAAACGHPFCVKCWQGYISAAINDGPGCLILRCPDPSCSAAVGQYMVNILASKDDKEKYNRYFLRSFVEDNRKRKWCPAPGCDYAVNFIVGSGNYDVTCRCSHSFCWNCVEEAHRPVDCQTAFEWICTNFAVSENMNWILPGEYEAAMQDEVFDEAENSLERYTHYYERWATNQSSWQRAVESLHQMQTVHLEKLSDTQCQPESQLKFIIEAWLQIVQCRRVLKWMNAYGYYLPEREQARKRFFEYLQGEAEFGLERLHQCAEKEFQGYLNSEGPSKDFNEFRKKLAGLTSVTKNYFENLVRALENGV